MRIDLSRFWSPEGKIGRLPYVVVGIVGFAIKHQIDRLVARGFDREWTLASYWLPLGMPGRLTELFGGNTAFFLTLLLVALPFVWLGVAFTLKRLRACGWSLHLVVLFFLPYVNLILFTLLAFVPSRRTAAAGASMELSDAAVLAGRPSSRDRLISAALALSGSVLLGLAFTLASATGLGLYSWSLFVGMPFLLGLISVLLYARLTPRGVGESLVISLLAPVLLGVSLLGFKLEGAVCLLMAAPLGCALSVMGGLIGHAIQRRSWGRRRPQTVLGFIAFFLPLLLGADNLSRPTPPLLLVATAVEIDAPPVQVWQEVVDFPDIGPPREWLFRAGVAYPTRAFIEGRGPGAIRRCVFSTGEFIEPIEIWDEPRRLEFAVRSNPWPMREWTPYGELRAPHLDGYFVARRGRFLLVPLPGGRTRLEGWTWYQNTMWPGPYWRLWSDGIIRRIHTRVLEHIRVLAEKQTDVLR